MNQLLAMRAFVRVADTGSFARTADQLSLPRSTVSKLVADLEAHLGAKLVQRTTRKVTVTPDGMSYRDRAAALLQEIDEIDDAARGANLGPRGRLRIDAPVSFARRLLIPALPHFAARYPDIRIALGSSDRQVSLVGEGVDCVIRGGEQLDSSLIARKLLDLEFGTYASPAYVARYGCPQHPDDLKSEHRLVGYFSPASERPIPLIFERQGKRVEFADVDFAANEGEAHLAMTLAGLGIGQHFARFVEPMVDSGTLIPLLPDWHRPPFPMHIVYLRHRHRSARLAAFIDWISETNDWNPNAR